MNIRAATAEDSEALALLHRRCFETAWNAADFEVTLAEPHGKALLALQEGAIVGCILFRTVADEAEILSIFIVPEIQRHGIGRQLLAHCMADLRKEGIAMLYLEAPENNVAALGLYKDAGFQKTGRRRNYYRLNGKAVDAVLMKYAL